MATPLPAVPELPAVPYSTYRVQLHPGFTFDDAADIVDYLRALGVGHFYSSPVLQAAPGSTHGYDVVDPSRANSELGGEAGRLRLARRLADAGLGTVLDIVPNHMSVAVPKVNRWWWDVLERGQGSPYAAYFDIDWSQGRLLLPVLGEATDELEKLTLVDGELAYYDHRFPIADGTGHGTPIEVHDRQHYELANWRRGNTELNYRRFFDITDLAGLRVEDENVFTDSHRELLRWVAAGQVQGLRIDHPDGLADPAGYLDRLAEAAPGTWVVVEKILEGAETLPASWATAGTTGYDALRLLCGVFVDQLGEAGITATYRAASGEVADIGVVAHDLQVRAATTVLRAETERLARTFTATSPGVDHDSAVAAIAELAAALGVYRTYLPGDGAEYLDDALARATAQRPDLAKAIDAVGRAARDAGSAFCTRWQQTTGMVMAKGVEDTTFYRSNRFIALNEVGGDPAQFGVGVEEFHRAVAARAATHPDAMTALSTHDTKRSEDVRARLAVLAEIPEVWHGAVEAFAERHQAPDPNLGQLAWQSLVGAWPIDAPRFGAYLEKASREAKQYTSWTDADPDYDATRTAFVDELFADPQALADVAEFVGRIAPHGWVNSLGQKLLATTVPGVPDIYQGTELWDLSLVDPDNRRPVDYAARRALLAELDESATPPPLDESGAAKLWVVSRMLRARREHPTVFSGDYASLAADGSEADHVVAHTRDAGALVAVATRLPARLHAAGGWQDTMIELPPGSYEDLLSPGTVHSGQVRLGAVLGALPVAALLRQP